MKNLTEEKDNISVRIAELISEKAFSSNAKEYFTMQIHLLRQMTKGKGN